MSLSDYRHQMTMPVHWGDVDMLGHVNNVMYFRYVESARTAYLANVFPESCGELWKETGVILANIECNFRRPLYYPTDVVVGTRITGFGTKSATLEAAIFKQGEDDPVAVTKAVIVWMDYQQGTTEPWPDAVKRTIMAYEGMDN